jgi:hypothetical protein
MWARRCSSTTIFSAQSFVSAKLSFNTAGRYAEEVCDAGVKYCFLLFSLCFRVSSPTAGAPEQHPYSVSACVYCWIWVTGGVLVPLLMAACVQSAGCRPCPSMHPQSLSALPAHLIHTRLLTMLESC